MSKQTSILAAVWDLAHDALEADASNNAALTATLEAIREKAAEGLADVLALHAPADDAA